MTYPPPPPPHPEQPPIVPGGGPVWPPPVPTGPKRKWGAGKIVLLVVGIVVLLCVGGGVLIAALGGDVKAPVATGKTTAAKSVATTQPAAEPVVEPTVGPTPAKADFELTPKIKKKQCFGSAGCLVQYEVDVAYGGPALDPGDTWVITYEATGDESGPVTNQIELTGKQYTSTRESVSTKNSGTRIRIKITGIEKQ